MKHPALQPNTHLTDGQAIEVAGVSLTVLHTPGHSPGAVCLHLAEQGVLFSGDTLFEGGPGATGRSFSDRPTILASITERLLTLPPETVVHTGHGPDTTIGAEAGNIT
jgi:glyoxylase-like metal-dependent hydrolase (beta-lactamase superfamily II)